MEYYVELEANNSAAFANEQETADFRIPKQLQSFVLYASSMDEAVRLAFGYLQGLTETPFDKITMEHFSETNSLFSFPNFKDGLVVTYTVLRSQVRPFHFVTMLPQKYQDLIVWRLHENGITDSEDVEHALCSRVSSLEDAIDITDMFCGEAINKCTFCGKLDFSPTKQIGGYTILDSCENCADEI